MAGTENVVHRPSAADSRSVRSRRAGALAALATVLVAGFVLAAVATAGKPPCKPSECPSTTSSGSTTAKPTSSTTTTAQSDAATSGCTLYAATSGSDSAGGTSTAPLRTVQSLVNHLSSGQTGCLYGGAYTGNLSISAAGITLMSIPGQRAKLLGYIWIKNTANDTRLRDLEIDGYAVSPPPVQVNGDRVLLSNLDITNRNKPGTAYNGMCVLAGPNFEATAANVAYDLRVERSRIHNCGDDAHEHAIYLESTRNAVVTDSYLYDNPGYGVHMYPDAQGSVIEYSVIDGNSSRCKANVTFSGESAGGEYARAHSSSNNVVRYSVITNSLCRYNVESYYPSGTAGSGNVVESSCVWNAPSGNFDFSDGGYAQRNNPDVDPRYVDRSSKNFALQSGSPCAAYGPRSGGTTSPPPSPPPPPPTITPPPPPAALPDFSLSVRSSISIRRGRSATAAVGIVPLNGFAGAVLLRISGLPTGATAGFSPNPAVTSSTLTIKVSRRARRGTSTLRLQGTSGDLVKSASVVLTVTN